jgi:hypothetical protein
MLARYKKIVRQLKVKAVLLVFMAKNKKTIDPKYRINA